jgi:predicted aldo/keto reductase-like oxidoreductase
MPCPRNVNIPGSFAAYNTSFSLGRITGMQQYVTSIGLTSAKWGGPVQCVKCGKCESHCPQHLPIIKNLEEVRRRMEPPPIRAAFALARRVMIKKSVENA